MTSEDRPTCTFCVIYRWRLQPGLESQFVAAWERATRAIRAERGGLGSRLHKLDDGSWLAYAQWPTRADWERARAAPTPDPEAAEIMRAAIAESDPPLLLEPAADLLFPVSSEPPWGRR